MQKSTVVTFSADDLNEMCEGLVGGAPKVSVPRTDEGELKISVEYNAGNFAIVLAEKLDVDVEALDGMTISNKKTGGIAVTY